MYHFSNEIVEPHMKRLATHLQSPETVERIAALLEWLLPRCLAFVRSNIKEVQPSMDGNLAVSLMRLLAALLPADLSRSAFTGNAAGAHSLLAG